MTFILRKVRKNRWYKSENFSWLEEGELQADPLGDLVTQENKLSVWCIDDNKSNLERVVAALSANSDDVSNLDYVLFSERILSEVKVKFEDVEGNSPDKVANSWHRDIVELSAIKLIELAKSILKNAEIDRIPEKKILNLIGEGIDSGQIEYDKLKPKVREKINKLKYDSKPR